MSEPAPPLPPIAGAGRVPARLAAFYAAIFLLVGVQVPYWPVWLAERGLAAAEIGIVLGAALWLKVAINPLIAQAADRRGDLRGPMILLAGVALAGFALFTVAHGFWALLLVTVAAATGQSPLMPLAETLTLRSAERMGFHYGRVRLWGSLAFIVAATGGGWLLAGRPESLILWLVLAAATLVFAAALALPATPPAGDPAAAGAGRAPIRRLAASPPFLLLLLTAGLVQSGHAVYYGFATLHWSAAGLSPEAIGVLWAEGVVAEIVLFACGAGLLARLGPERLLACAALAGVLRWTAIGLSTALPLLAAVQLLHAFTFGAAHLAAMTFFARHVAPSVSATALSLYSAVVMGAGMGLAMPAAGALYAAAGGGVFFLSAGLCAAGAAAAAALARRRPTAPIGAEPGAAFIPG